MSVKALNERINAIKVGLGQREQEQIKVVDQQGVETPYEH